MLEELVRNAFERHHGVIKTHTLNRNNKITFILNKEKDGFVCDKGPAVFYFRFFNGLEKEMKMVSSHFKGKVYYGSQMTHSGVKMGESGWFENTIDGMVARRFFSIPDGKSPYRCAPYVAALLQKVGFASPHPRDSIDNYITLIGGKN